MPAEPRYRALGRRLRAARERAGMSQDDAGEFLGVAGATISRYEKGLNKIPIPDVERLATLYGVSPESLLAIDVPSGRTPREILLELEETIRKREEQAAILIPEAEQVISAGPGAPSEPEVWPYWPQAGERSHDFTVVRVRGTCMEPRIREGERVVVDKTESPRPGHIVAAVVDGENVVKMLERRNGDLYLVALQGRSPLKVTEGTRIIGVVKMVMHRP